LITISCTVGAPLKLVTLGVDQIPDQVRIDRSDGQVPAADRGHGPGKHQPLQWNIGCSQRRPTPGETGDDRLVESVEVGAAVRELDASGDRWCRRCS
jgi:hypothetical protein